MPAMTDETKLNFALPLTAEFICCLFILYAVTRHHSPSLAQIGSLSIYLSIFGSAVAVSASSYFFFNGIGPRRYVKIVSRPFRYAVQLMSLNIKAAWISIGSIFLAAVLWPIDILAAIESIGCIGMALVLFYPFAALYAGIICIVFKIKRPVED